MDNLIVLLCKNPNLWIKILSSLFLSNKIDTIIISDEDYKGNSTVPVFSYKDEEVIKMNMHLFDYHFNSNHKSPAAWDKAIYHFYKTGLTYDYYYFFEDDIYSPKQLIFMDLIRCLITYKEDLITYNIRKINRDDITYKLYKEDKRSENTILKSFNPFMRMSKAFLQELLNYYDRNRCFYFHEILIPTLCYNSHLSMIDIMEDKKLNLFFTYYRPHYNKGNVMKTLENKKYIYNLFHPIKFKYNCSQ